MCVQVRSQISHGHPSRIGGDFSAPLILERLELLNRCGLDARTALLACFL